MSVGHVFTTTDSTFAADVLQSPEPVLVDVWGEWCGPCKALAPMLEQLANDYGSRMKVAKLEIDRNPMTSLAYGVHSVPTMLLFKGGQVQATPMGLIPKSRLVKHGSLRDCHMVASAGF
jgi:thioredoxin 1